jgi:hypothetical protein
MGYNTSIISKTKEVLTKVKPYLPCISRFLIVATFYEDASRSVWQWEDQQFYLKYIRQIPSVVVNTFLVLNVLVKITSKSKTKNR